MALDNSNFYVIRILRYDFCQPLDKLDRAKKCWSVRYILRLHCTFEKSSGNYNFVLRNDVRTEKSLEEKSAFMNRFSHYQSFENSIHVAFKLVSNKLSNSCWRNEQSFHRFFDSFPDSLKSEKLQSKACLHKNFEIGLWNEF